MRKSISLNRCFPLHFRILILAPEFGSMASAWKAIMSEADASAEVHQAVHDELQSDIIPSIKSWQKAKYTKSMMHTKPTKDFDEEFKRVCVKNENKNARH